MGKVDVVFLCPRCNASLILYKRGRDEGMKGMEREGNGKKEEGEGR